jgi:hypothetical protein
VCVSLWHMVVGTGPFVSTDQSKQNNAPNDSGARCAMRETKIPLLIQYEVRHEVLISMEVKLKI